MSNLEEAKRWLGREVLAQRKPEYLSSWDEDDADATYKLQWIEDAWVALVTVLGEDSAQKALIFKRNEALLGGQQ